MDEQEQDLQEVLSRIASLELTVNTRVADLESRLSAIETAAVSKPIAAEQPQINLNQLPDPPRLNDPPKNISNNQTRPPDLNNPAVFNSNIQNQNSFGNNNFSQPNNVSTSPNSFGNPQPPAQTYYPKKKENQFDVSAEFILRWAGIVLITFATIFLVSTAISRGWIGPELQLFGASLTGVAMFVGAYLLTDKRPVWAQSFVGAGSVILLSCATATHAWLELVDASTGFVLLTVTLILVVCASVYFNFELVAIISVFLSYFMFSWLSVSVLSISIWLACLACAAVALGLGKSWKLFRVLIPWSAALGILLALPLGKDFTENTRVVLVLSVAATAIVLWNAPAIAQKIGTKLTDKSKTQPVDKSFIDEFNFDSFDHRLTMAIPGWVFLCCLIIFSDLIGKTTRGAWAIGIAAGFLALAFATYKQLPKTLFISHALGALGLLAVGFTLLFDGPVFVVSIAAQALGTAVLAFYFKDWWLRISSYMLLGVSFVLAMYNLIELADSGDVDIILYIASFAVIAVASSIAYISWIDNEIPEDSVQLITTSAWGMFVILSALIIVPHIPSELYLSLLAVYSVATYFASKKLGEYMKIVSYGFGCLLAFFTGLSIQSVMLGGGTYLQDISNLFALAVILAACWYIWVKVKSLSELAFIVGWILSLGYMAEITLNGPQGQAITSLVWALAAGSAIVVGLMYGHPVIRQTGLVTLGIVLVKLLTIDLAEVDTFWRVGLFFIVGSGLLALGYFVPSLSLSNKNKTSKPETEPAKDNTKPGL